MFEDPITLIASIVLLVAAIGMGGIAKDQMGVKGLNAVFFMSFPLGIFHYIRISRENNKVGILFWIFLVSLAFIIYRVP